MIPAREEKATASEGEQTVTERRYNEEVRISE
jgi:hypothetical protein